MSQKSTIMTGRSGQFFGTSWLDDNQSLTHWLVILVIFFGHNEPQIIHNNWSLSTKMISCKQSIFAKITSNQHSAITTNKVVFLCISGHMTITCFPDDAPLYLDLIQYNLQKASSGVKLVLLLLSKLILWSCPLSAKGKFSFSIFHTYPLICPSTVVLLYSGGFWVYHCKCNNALLILQISNIWPSHTYFLLITGSRCFIMQIKWEITRKASCPRDPPNFTTVHCGGPS